MSQSPYLATAQRKRCSGSSVTARERHVGAVAGAEDGQALAVDPVERAQVVGGGQAVLRVVDAPHAVVEALVVAPVAGRAAEVERQPRVALVDEVLGVAVPVVDVGVGRAAVRIDDRRHRAVGRGVLRAAQEGRDLQAVEGGERDLLELGVGRAARRRAARGREGAGRGRQAQLGRRGVVLVGADDRAAGRPARAAPGPALGDDLGLAASPRRRRPGRSGCAARGRRPGACRQGARRARGGRRRRW